MGYDSAGQVYLFCVLSALAVLFNLLLLLLAASRLRISNDYSYMRVSIILQCLAYAGTALGWLLMLIYYDIHTTILCQLGGFLIILGCQTSVWVQATTATGLCLWTTRRLPADIRKQSLLFYGLIVGAEFLILLLISILPYTKLLQYAISYNYHHVCTPLRLPGEQGWALSALIIILSWIAVLITVITLSISSLRLSNCSLTKDPERGLQRTVLVAECVSCLGWLVVLLVLSISYSGSGALHVIQWVLGLALCLAIVLTPVLAVTLHCQRRCALDNCCPATKYALPDAPQPEDIVLVTEWTQDTEHGELVHAECRWAGPDGRHVGGHVRAWVGNANALVSYHRERYITAMLREKPHQNVVTYQWSSHEVPLLSAMGLAEHSHASLLCHEELPLGTLREYVQSEGSRTSAEVIRVFALDLLSALQHLHSQRVVYNNCSTSSIYVTQHPKGDLHAVIAGFDQSYQVSSMYDKERDECVQYMQQQALPPDRPPDLLSITSYLNASQGLTKNKYSADARAFGLIMLDLLVMASGAESPTQPLSINEVSQQEVRNKTVDMSCKLEVASAITDMNDTVDLDVEMINEKEQTPALPPKSELATIHSGEHLEMTVIPSSKPASNEGHDIASDMADASSVHTDYTLSEESLSDRRWTPSSSRMSPWPRQKAILTNGSLMSTPRSTPEVTSTQVLSLPPNGGLEAVTSENPSPNSQDRPLPPLPSLSNVSTSTDDLTVVDMHNVSKIMCETVHMASVSKPKTDRQDRLTAAVKTERPFTDYDCPPPRPPKVPQPIYNQGFPTILEDESVVVPPRLYPRRSRKAPPSRTRLSMASMASSMESGDSGLGSDIYRNRIQADSVSMFSTPSMEEVGHTTYEVLPDLPDRPRREKMPCVGSHEDHVPGCCAGYTREEDSNSIYWNSQRPTRARSSTSSSSSSSYPDMPPYPTLTNHAFVMEEEHILKVMKKFMPVLLSRAELPTTGPRSTNI